MYIHGIMSGSFSTKETKMIEKRNSCCFTDSYFLVR